MKIAHLPFCYYPDAVGGTEVYVRALAREQIRLGDQVCIIAPAEHDASYEHEGIRVHRYAVQSVLADVRELYAARSSVSVASFLRILDQEQPDVLHVHGYTRAVPFALLEQVRARGIRIVFTYHTPTATCLRGTLMRFGTVVCDGALIPERCAACVLQSRGVPRLLAHVAAHTPTWPTRLLRRGRIATGLRMRELVRLRHAEIGRFLQQVDHIIAPAQWVLELLLRLGVPRRRITLNRQGISYPARAAAPAERESAVLKLVFVGRLDRVKGLHIILDALRLLPAVRVELHVYGVRQDAAADEVLAAVTDARVVLHEPLPSDELYEVLSGYDVMVVPSQWLETGPLVVLEAFAAGVPVIGSDLGGIAELVRHEMDGLLVPAHDAGAWAAAIQRVANDRNLLARLRANVARPRTMQQVAIEMQRVFAAVLQAS